MREIKFINDYYCGKHPVWNTLDWDEESYWDSNNSFYKNQFAYLKNFESKGKTPKSFDNKFKFMRNKFKTISTYEYLRKTKEYKNDALFYEVCVYSNAENAFGNTDDFLLDKIPSKIIKAINKSNNIFILLNYSSEGFISEECLLNINNWIKNNMPFFQFILVNANYNIFEWYDEFVKKYEIEETFTVIPYLWSFPQFVNMIQYGGFNNQKLNKNYDFEIAKKYDFNCLMRRLRPLRTKLLLDFDKLELLHKNQISYDTHIDDMTDENFYNNIERLSPTKKDEGWKRFCEIRKRKPKQIVDYDDLNKVNGIGMETDIPYKDSMFTVVAESYFFENQNIGYISEKIWKPIIHKHPFIVFGNVKVLAHLQHWGFKTFGETGFIDESYDLEIDPHKRYVMVMKQILSLCNLSDKNKKNFMFNAQKIANFNFEHFRRFNINDYNDTFMEYINPLVQPPSDLEKTLF